MKRRLMSLLMRVILPCATAARLSSAALDRPLSARERRALRWHLLLCGMCRRYDRQWRELHQVLHQQPMPLTKPAAGLSPAARDRLRQALHNLKEQP